MTKRVSVSSWHEVLTVKIENLTVHSHHHLFRLLSVKTAHEVATIKLTVVAIAAAYSFLELLFVDAIVHDFVLMITAKS
jgi:hypothetical protein